MTHHTETEIEFQPSNRRVARRYQLNVPLQCNGRPATSINISRSGIRYVSPKPLNTGSEAQLNISFGEDTVELVGETVWSEPMGTSCVVGAAFREGPGTESLSRYLDQLIQV